MSEGNKVKLYNMFYGYCIRHNYTREQKETFFKVLCSFADLCDSEPSKNTVENAIQAFKEGYESAKNS